MNYTQTQRNAMLKHMKWDSTLTLTKKTIRKLIQDCNELQKELEKTQKALSLANSMILSGEQHSETSEKMISEALKEGNDEKY